MPVLVVLPTVDLPLAFKQLANSPFYNPLLENKLMSARHINDCTPVESDANLGPPRVGWRNLLAQCMKTGVFAVFSIASILPLNALAADYQAKICLIDMFNAPASGLTVTTGSNAATTDASGCATITGLAETTYELTISGSYKQLGSRTFKVGSNHRTHNFGTVHAIKVTNGYRIEGVVVDSSGNLSGVKVSVSGKQVATDASGKFGINFSAAGSYTLTFEKSGYPTVTKSFAVSDSRPLSSSNVRLSMGYVQIRFIDMFGQVVNGLNVTSGGKTATLNGGYYLIEGLSSGNYTLSMANAGYKPFSRTFTLSSSRTSQNFGSVYLIKTSNGYRIEGKVINASGQAFAGVSVSAEGKSATTDSEGKFFIYFSSAKTYTLTFAKAGYLSVTNNYSVSDSSPLRYTGNVRVIDGYSVTGTVLDINKQGLAGVTVTAGGKTAISDASGKYTVTGISTSGSHTLTLSKGGSTISRTFSISASQPIYSMSTLYLVDDYLVYGGIFDVFGKPIAGIRVEASGNSSVTDAEGQYHISVSEAGQHTITLKQTGYKEVTKYASVSDTSPTGSAGNMYAISTTNGYNIIGTVKLVDSTVPFSKVTVTVGDITATPNADGNFIIRGLIVAGGHTVTVHVDSVGYRDISRSFSVYDHRPSVSLGTSSFAPNLSMAMATSSTKIELGGVMVYTVNITNTGFGPANQVKMHSSPALPAGVQFVSADVVEPKLPNYNIPAGGGIEDNCNIAPETRVLECQYLGTLGGGQTTKMEVKVSFVGTSTSTTGGSGGPGGHGSGPGGLPNIFSLSFGASGLPCLNCSGGDIVPIEAPLPAPRNLEVKHFLTMGISGGTSQLEVGESTSYNVTVNNSQTATSAVTNTKLKITLPEIVDLTSATSTEGDCSANNSVITCDLYTLVSDTTVSIAVELKSKFVGVGKLAFALTSKQVPSIDKSSATFSVIPQPPKIKEELGDLVVGDIPVGIGNADLMLVVDDTGSMGEEVEALIAAINEFIPTLTGTSPTVGLVTFKDSVSQRVITNNMSTLLSYVRRIRADYGDDCPESSLMALKEALPKLKVGGRMILATDASSHTDVNVDNLITALRSKGVRVDVILSGDDCVGVCEILDAGGDNSVGAIEVFSRIAEETGGLFATPFEVNAGTVSGATRYHKVALNVMRSTVSPSVTSVAPNYVPQGATIDLNLIAANTSFKSDSEVSFGEGIVVNEVEVLSPTKMNVSVTISDTASANFRDVTVTTPQGGDTSETAKGSGVLEVVATFEDPQILGITPTAVARDGSATVKIAGANTHFNNGSRLSFGDGITVQDVTATSQNSLTATVNVSSDASLGLHKATVTTNGVAVTNSCSGEISPATGSLVITPSLAEGTVPRIMEVTPNSGATGSLRKLDITAVNTHFVQDVTELSFGDQPGLYILELTVVSETQLKALVQIDPEADLGFWDVFAYTDDEFASLLDGFEVTPRGPCSIQGYVINKIGEPVADVELDTGDLFGFTDDSGYFMITGLWEGVYDMAINGGGSSDLVEFIVSDNTAINGDASSENCLVPLPITIGSSDLVVSVKPGSWLAYQGDMLTYTITVANTGDTTATGIAFTDQLPEGAKFVSAETLGGGECVADTDNTVTCTLPDLGPNQDAKVEVKVLVDQIVKRSVVNTVSLISNEYPPDVTKTWSTFRPYLSVYIDDDRDPVAPDSAFFYTVDVELSQYAESAATGVKLVSYLPAGVELKSVNSDYANCDTSNFPTISCDVVDLDVGSLEAGVVSHIEVHIGVVVKDPGSLLLIHEARVSAKEYPIHTARERTWVDIGEGFVDIIFLLDQTGSMQGEINSVVRAITDVIDELDGTTAPWLALVTFKDDVKLRAATQDLELFRKILGNLKAEGGGTCPEAAVEALVRAIPHIKEGGLIFLATDASPYPDADVVGVTKLLTEKNIRFNAMVTGDCTMGESWNPLTGTE